jgi:hypothetical protein
MTGLSFEDRCEVSEYLRRIFEDPPQTSDIPGDNLEAADGESCQSHSWCSVASHTLATRCCVGEFKFKNLEESKVQRLKKISESLSIGFQVNRAIRIEHIIKRGLFGGFGLGVEDVRGLG